MHFGFFFFFFLESKSSAFNQKHIYINITCFNYNSRTVHRAMTASILIYPHDLILIRNFFSSEKQARPLSKHLNFSRNIFISLAHNVCVCVSLCRAENKLNMRVLILMSHLINAHFLYLFCVPSRDPCGCLQIAIKG